MSIPEFWRSRFRPRDPIAEPEPRPAFPDTEPNPFQGTEQVEHDVARLGHEGAMRDAFQEGLAQFNERRARWEL